MTAVIVVAGRIVDAPIPRSEDSCDGQQGVSSLDRSYREGVGTVTAWRVSMGSPRLQAFCESVTLPPQGQAPRQTSLTFCIKEWDVHHHGPPVTLRSKGA